MRAIVFSLLFALCLAPCSAMDRGTFGEFRRSLNTTTYGYRLIKDFTGKAPAKEIEAFEVHPGDAGKDAWYDDTKNDRERSELSQIQKDQKPGDTLWYGWYLYLPQNYQNIFPVKVTLGQFHQESARPAWMFENADGGYWIYNQVSRKTKEKYPLIDESSLRGKWHKIEVQAHWSKDSDGFFKVWVNGALKVDYKGATMSAERVYFKYGLYRSFLSRYAKAGKLGQVPAQTAYYACVKRGNSRAAIQP